jgi:hypothetical protein
MATTGYDLVSQISVYWLCWCVTSKLNWQSSNQQLMSANLQIKQELPVGDIFVNISGRNQQSLWRTYHICFLPSFSPHRQFLFYLKISRHQLLIWWLPIEFTGDTSAQSVNRYLWHQVIIDDCKFSNRWQRGTFLLTYRDEISDPYGGPTIYASYQVSVHLASGFGREDF